MVAVNEMKKFEANGLINICSDSYVDRAVLVTVKIVNDAQRISFHSLNYWPYKTVEGSRSLSAGASEIVDFSRWHLRSLSDA